MEGLFKLWHGIGEGLEEYMRTQIELLKAFHTLIRATLENEHSKILESVKERWLKREPPFSFSYINCQEKAFLNSLESEIEHVIRSTREEVFKEGRIKRASTSLNLLKCLYAVSVDDRDMMVEYFKSLTDFLNLNSIEKLLGVLGNRISIYDSRKMMLFLNSLYIKEALEIHSYDYVVNIKKFDRLQYLPPVLLHLYQQKPIDFLNMCNRFLRNLKWEFLEKIQKVCSERKQVFKDVAGKLQLAPLAKNQRGLLNLSRALLKHIGLEDSENNRECSFRFLELLRSIYESLTENEGILNLLQSPEIAVSAYVESIMCNIMEFSLNIFLITYGILPLTNVYLHPRGMHEEVEVDVFVNLPKLSDSGIYYKPIFFECKLKSCDNVSKKDIENKAQKLIDTEGTFVILCNLGDDLYRSYDNTNIIFINALTLTMPEVLIGILYSLP